MCLLLLLPAMAAGYNVLEHAWLGYETIDTLWQDLDPAFHEAINAGPTQDPDSIVSYGKTVKFYLIGTMLPDVFTPEAQSMLRSMMYKLNW